MFLLFTLPINAAMHPTNNTHHRLLSKWRKSMDLIGPSNMEHHFEDSMNCVSLLPNCPTWIDLGSGAGFPGFALSAAQPDAQITMVESRQKRCVFLRAVSREAKTSNITILNTRTDKVTERYHGIISRAYKPPIDYLFDAERLLKPNGYVALMLGQNTIVDLPSQWVCHSKHEYPVSDHKRCLWLLQIRRHS
jgi:16S rRNA (guanine(527)-N(7))-methyltransferase RsmG